jgi:two-component system chemotaxis response regulator CheB
MNARDNNMAKTRVVVVDDSAWCAACFTEIINRQPDMECVGAASDPVRGARDDPLEESRRDHARRRDAAHGRHRLPEQADAPAADARGHGVHADRARRRRDAARAGAGRGRLRRQAKIGIADGLRLLAQDITEKVRIASKAHLRRVVAAPAAAPASDDHGASRDAPSPLGRMSTEKLIFIGASRAGTEATKEVLTHLPPDSPAVVITQHMPPASRRAMRRGSTACARSASPRRATATECCRGHAYIAPGGFHLSVERSGANYIARVQDGDPVNRHKPSVEVLFKSAARVAAPTRSR